MKNARIYWFTGLSGFTPDLVLDTDNCTVNESVSDPYSFVRDF